MGLSEAGKGFLLFSVVILTSIILLTITLMLFKPIEYSANCSISGVNLGINNEMNFTGFNLNNSEIKCDISGKAPLLLFLKGFG